MENKIINNNVLLYCESHSTPQSPVLYQLERETHLKTLAPQMLSGHLQGEFLAMISALLRPKRILEIGTFTGYSAICLARGLAEGGELHTIEANGELEHIIRKYVAESNMSDRIVLHLGDALAIIPTLDETFDLVFIDAGKVDYSMYYDLVFKKMRIGGLMLADNVLWSGKVLDGDSQDADTQSLQAFNQKVLQDVRVEKVMLPLRDGLLLIRKIKE